MDRGFSENQAQETRAQLECVLYEMKKVIVGQEHLLERLLLAVIVGGHVLVEGPPGLAKTLTLHCLSQVLHLDFQRIQFTPDLLPSDLLGTRIYNPAQGLFQTERGPLFSHFILADEINRAPAKVQSALLEAMQEKQITIGRETFSLPEPFLVMATQNPIESEGTYSLPEAQLDRFLFKVLVTYPNVLEEGTIIQRMAGEETPPLLEPLLDGKMLLRIRAQARAVYLDPKLIHEIAELVATTRDETLTHLRYGASPRASISIALSARAHALFQGRNYATLDDIKAVLHDCLRHRLLLSYEGLSQGFTPDRILDDLLLKQPFSMVNAPVQIFGKEEA
jgi:MoxR-like ATPase